ncbi:acyl-CoA dehydrogenase family protein [Nonomuraea typhae]|uniref:Medium-chain specific acyl-CoA dehydrogenase, mitochondrial n=1 Tax=Nonomuraea typhae TaxID=2603600 RepID=A0ABW7ZCH5_9ACTN
MITPAAMDLQARARRFVENVLMPLENEAERRGGRLPAETIAEVRREAIAARLNGGLHAVEHGGQGWSRLEWALVEEQYGRTTNAIHWHVPYAYNVWEHASTHQIDRYLRPALRGELRDAYAVTERGAGSDPSGIEATAVRTKTGFRLNAEKWFVTAGDHADVFIVMANVADGLELLPTLFIVDRDRPGVEVIEDPAFTHNYPDGHPTIRFRDVELPGDSVIGGIGKGEALQRSWFTEERLAIAARCSGVIWRLLDETVAWATSRQQGGQRIYDYQGVSFPLADSAADAAAGRMLTLAVAELADAGADPKLVHHKASMAKLFMSEAAWRCADRCVQTFGGRGYLRSNVAERMLREVRVDRIWEGTSEIQRLIVARGLERRGVEAMLRAETGK